MAHLSIILANITKQHKERGSNSFWEWKALNERPNLLLPVFSIEIHGFLFNYLLQNTFLLMQLEFILSNTVEQSPDKGTSSKITKRTPMRVVILDDHLPTWKPCCSCREDSHFSMCLLLSANERVWNSILPFRSSWIYMWHQTSIQFSFPKLCIHKYSNDFGHPGKILIGTHHRLHCKRAEFPWLKSFNQLN